MIQSNMRLARPKNQRAHLLRELIKGKMISERQFQYNRFRGSISDLVRKYSIPLKHKDVPFENVFGRKSHYRRHYLMLINRTKAIKVYNEINK